MASVRDQPGLPGVGSSWNPFSDFLFLKDDITKYVAIEVRTFDKDRVNENLAPHFEDEDQDSPPEKTKEPLFSFTPVKTEQPLPQKSNWYLHGPVLFSNGGEIEQQMLRLLTNDSLSEISQEIAQSKPGSAQQLRIKLMNHLKLIGSAFIDEEDDDFESDRITDENENENEDEDDENDGMDAGKHENEDENDEAEAKSLGAAGEDDDGSESDQLQPESGEDSVSEAKSNDEDQPESGEDSVSEAKSNDDDHGGVAESKSTAPPVRGGGANAGNKTQPSPTIETKAAKAEKEAVDSEVKEDIASRAVLRLSVFGSPSVAFFDQLPGAMKFNSVYFVVPLLVPSLMYDIEFAAKYKPRLSDKENEDIAKMLKKNYYALKLFVRFSDKWEPSDKYLKQLESKLIINGYMSKGEKIDDAMLAELAVVFVNTTEDDIKKGLL